MTRAELQTKIEVKKADLRDFISKPYDNSREEHVKVLEAEIAVLEETLISDYRPIKKQSQKQKADIEDILNY